MFTLDLKIDKSPIVNVVTTENRGFTPDEVAHRCTEKIMSISENSPPAIRAQAVAFKMHIEKLLRFTCGKLFAVTVLLCIMLSSIQVIQNWQR